MNKLGKILKNIALISLSMVLGAFLVLTQFGVPTFKASGYEDHSHYLREIVNEKPSFANTPLTEISLLGSHDALSDEIDMWSKPNSSEDNLVNNPWLRIFGKGAIVRYSRAQNDSIYHQLQAGVRYMDIRVTNIDGVFYNSHGLVSSTFRDNLSKILRFLDENPGEFVLMQICKYYKGNATDQELYQMMESVYYKEKNIFDYIHYENNVHEFKDLTYNILTNNGNDAGVVLFASSSQVNMAPFNQFNMSHCDSHWHNTIDEKEMTREMVEYSVIGKTLGTDYLRINQAQQTPNTNEIWETFLGWSLLSMAEYHNHNVVNREDIMDILDGLPIYMCDFSTCNTRGFNTKIISLMRQRNLSL